MSCPADMSADRGKEAVSINCPTYMSADRGNMRIGPRPTFGSMEERKLQIQVRRDKFFPLGRVNTPVNRLQILGAILVSLNLSALTLSVRRLLVKPACAL